MCTESEKEDEETKKKMRQSYQYQRAFPGKAFGKKPSGGSSGDTTPPTIRIVAPVAGAIIIGTGISVTGSAGDNVGLSRVDVQINSSTLVPASLNFDGSWSVSFGNLPTGDYTIQAKATDASGNASYAVVTVSLLADSQPAPVPAPAPTGTGFVDAFDGANYILGAGQISPNGLWKGVFTSGGILQQTNGEMQLQPQAVTSPTSTSAPFVISTVDLQNFEATWQMRTIQQLRTGSAPNNWETAWLLFRYTDVTHHYYFTIKMNGAELGKKDNAVGNTNLEDQLFLATPGFPALQLGRYYNCKLRVEGYHIQVWVDGTRIVDYTDLNVHDPTKMSHGMLGMYSEDSKVAFDNFNVVRLP